MYLLTSFLRSLTSCPLLCPLISLYLPPSHILVSYSFRFLPHTWHLLFHYPLFSLLFSFLLPFTPPTYHYHHHFPYPYLSLFPPSLTLPIPLPPSQLPFPFPIPFPAPLTPLYYPSTSHLPLSLPYPPLYVSLPILQSLSHLAYIAE